MKNVLVLMHDDPGQEARLQVALDITRAIDGHLKCVDVTIVPRAIAEYDVLGGGAMLLDEEQKAETVNRDRMKARLAGEDVSYDWVDVTGDLSRAVIEQAGLCDLIVVNRHVEKLAFPDMASLVGELLIGSPKPIMAVPAEARRLDVRGHALVAWDGSLHAEDALRAATPLLALARAVTLLYADDGSMKLPIEAAASYLARHGVNTLVQEAHDLVARPGDIILEAASDGRADYVVMGGFSRPRSLESIFGGATHRMIADSPVPVLLAHHH